MVSIIMSAYDAEETIGRAIESCLNQTYKDVEIIIVNDCSKDSTEDIIKSYQNKTDKIKYYKNKINKGAGFSRWRGVHHIKGEFSIFLDSDDYYKEDLIETLVYYAKKYDSDLVSSGCISIYKNKEIGRAVATKEVVLEGMNKFDTSYTINRGYLFIHGSLIKSTLWEKVEYNKRRFIEDSPTFVQLIWCANKRVYIPYVGYYYTQNEKSLIHTASVFKDWIYRCLCCISTIEFFKDKNPQFCSLEHLKYILNTSKVYKIEKDEYKKYRSTLRYILNYYNKNIQTL